MAGALCVVGAVRQTVVGAQRRDRLPHRARGVLPVRGTKNVEITRRFCVAPALLREADTRSGADKATAVAQRGRTCSKTGASARETPSRAGRQPDPILVVDDDPVWCRLMALALEQEGYGVESTTDPREALELVRARPYALIVSDVSMPGMRGTMLVAEALKLQPGMHTLLVSALSDRQLCSEAEALGSRLLTKPVRLEVLSAAVRKLVDGGGGKQGDAVTAGHNDAPQSGAAWGVSRNVTVESSTGGRPWATPDPNRDGDM